MLGINLPVCGVVCALVCVIVDGVAAVDIKLVDVEAVVVNAVVTVVEIVGVAGGIGVVVPIELFGPIVGLSVVAFIDDKLHIHGHVCATHISVHRINPSILHVGSLQSIFRRKKKKK